MHGLSIKVPIHGMRFPRCLGANRAMDAAPHLSEHLEDQIRPLIRVFTPVFFVMVPRGESGSSLRRCAWPTAS